MKDREIRILEYKISELDNKIQLFQKYNISEKKIKKIIARKALYENKLYELQ